MIVLIWRERTSKPVKYDAIDAYQKGDMYCVTYIDKNQIKAVDKYPIDHLFRVTEEY